jgi:hypothetical protein
MAALMSQLSSDETFNRPLTRHRSPEVLAEHETALKVRLVEAIQAISLDRFLTERATLRPLEGIQLEGCIDQPRRVGVNQI